ncbi:MAG TPA: polyprenyl diphosphate synthase [Candidatus Paceibacterota bacterium]|nr:polyprenyl diphosphate synthase [Candidatus Paceibacterota bacterium]
MSKEEQKNIPNCIGIIPDGNRRWAKQHGLPSFEGHRRGGKKFRELLFWCREAGIKNVVVYAFSTENWQRSEQEVAFLKQILRETLEDFKDEETSLRFVGEVESFGEEFLELTQKLESETLGRKYRLFVAFSYGGRAELLTAAKKIATEKTADEIQNLSARDFKEALWSSDLPDIDLIVRTSGEKRLSNFFPWQSVYSELFFVPSYWPEFSREEFFHILEEYETRDRRKGK